VSTAGSTRHPRGLASLLPGLRVRVAELAEAVADGTPTEEMGPPSRTADLRRGVERYLLHLLAGVAGGLHAEPAHPPAPPPKAAAPGVPGEALLHAYRVGTHLLWDVLREAAEQDEQVDPSDLVRVATYLWHVHEATCAEVERIRRVPERRHDGQGREHRETLIAGLLEGRARRPADARDAAAYLKLRPAGRYVVVVVDVPDGAASVPRDLELQIAEAGFVSAWQHLPGQWIGIVDLGGGDLPPLVAAVDAAVTSRAGISPVVHQLADLPTARRHADTALLTIPQGGAGVAVLERDLPGALLAASPDLAALLLQEFLGPVLELDEAEREPLLATVRAYAASGASATDTARAVRCHRNTVLNRIKRFEVLSGQPLDRPETLLTTWLATRAHALTGADG
jgi:hypothetical protein